MRHAVVTRSVWCLASLLLVLLPESRIAEADEPAKVTPQEVLDGLKAFWANTALPDGSRFYTANSVSNDVTVVNATSYVVTKTIPVGQGPVWIASEPSSSKVYTANSTGGSVSIIQTSNDSLVTNMPAPPVDPEQVGFAW